MSAAAAAGVSAAERDDLAGILLIFLQDEDVDVLRGP